MKYSLIVDYCEFLIQKERKNSLELSLFFCLFGCAGRVGEILCWGLSGFFFKKQGPSCVLKGFLQG